MALNVRILLAPSIDRRQGTGSYPVPSLDEGRVKNRGIVPTRRRILVIEDDPAIRRGLCDALALSGYDTLESARGDTGFNLALKERYDLLLLDLVLPGGDGLAILEELRRVRPTTPVIILTARGDESDRLHGFRLGADDYVVKPFSIRELLARIDAVLRRTPERPLDVSTVPVLGGTAFLDRRELAFDDGARVELSQRECELLRYLAANRDRAIAREELLSRVWQLDPQGVATRTIDMHIVRLREKLRDDPVRPRVIATVRGKGYKWGLASVEPPAATRAPQSGRPISRPGSA